MANRSTLSQTSLILPASTRTIAVPVQLTVRPVAEVPNKGAPACTPTLEQRQATLSPSPTRSSTSVWKSGKAARIPAMTSTRPWRPTGCPLRTTPSATSSSATSKAPRPSTPQRSAALPPCCRRSSASPLTPVDVDVRIGTTDDLDAIAVVILVEFDHRSTPPIYAHPQPRTLGDIRLLHERLLADGARHFLARRDHRVSDWSRWSSPPRHHGCAPPPSPTSERPPAIPPRVARASATRSSVASSTGPTSTGTRRSRSTSSRPTHSHDPSGSDWASSQPAIGSGVLSTRPTGFQPTGANEAPRDLAHKVSYRSNATSDTHRRCPYTTGISPNTLTSSIAGCAGDRRKP